MLAIPSISQVTSHPQFTNILANEAHDPKFPDSGPALRADGFEPGATSCGLRVAFKPCLVLALKDAEHGIVVPFSQHRTDHRPQRLHRV